MTTSEFISHIIFTSNSGLTRSAALQLTNIAQQELLGLNTSFTKISPNPTLTTVAGTLTYVLPLGIRGVTRGWVDVGDAREYVEFQCPETSSNLNALNVIFDKNPGVSTINLDAFSWAPELTSEQIPLNIPTPHQTKALKTRVMSMIEEINFGNSVYWAERYKKDLSDWLAYSNQGAQIRSGRVIPSNIYG